MRYKDGQKDYKICLDPGPLGCKLEVNLNNGLHNGGGTFFIQKFLSNPSILSRFKATENVMEMCSGFGGMGYYLAHKLNLKEAVFVDVDPSVEQTIAANIPSVPFYTQFYLSSAFDNYNGPKVDLIILNPPHVTKESEFLQIQSEKPNWFPIDKDERSRLILLDKDFKFHKSFCKDAHKHLTKKGQIAFLENEKYIPHTLIIDELGEKYNYEFIQLKETEEEGYYLLIANRK
jgi:methylase of polypeptide subunit release factors